MTESRLDRRAGESSNHPESRRERVKRKSQERGACLIFGSWQVKEKMKALGGLEGIHIQNYSKQQQQQQAVDGWVGGSR